MGGISSGDAATPRVLYPLARAGDQSLQAVEELPGPARDALQDVDEKVVAELGDALSTWQDEAAADVVREFGLALTSRGPTAADFVASAKEWVSAHPNDVGSVRACSQVRPPAGIRVKKLLSRAGGQKVVFQGEWLAAGRLVVLKQLIASSTEQAKILAREVQAHPLSLSHPNIIETHSMVNEEGVAFLVEEFLPEILGDEWQPSGLEEAANLLFDISSALAFLHETVQHVHADVKPDNIGRRGNVFILLDFGMCRPLDELAEATATGSLRTRAPEVLRDASYAIPDRVDVWALGAVLFNAYERRFPLFDAGEHVPPVAQTQDREALLSLLEERARSEWETRLRMSATPAPLKKVLSPVLLKNPDKRLTAPDLRALVLNTLFPYLRRQAFDAALYSPNEEIAQYDTWLLSDADATARVPLPVRQRIRDRLEFLRTQPGLGKPQTVDRLLDLLK